MELTQEAPARGDSSGAVYEQQEALPWLMPGTSETAECFGRMHRFHLQGGIRRMVVSSGGFGFPFYRGDEGTFFTESS